MQCVQIFLDSAIPTNIIHNIINGIWFLFDTTNNQIYTSGSNTLKFFDMNRKTYVNKPLYGKLMDYKSSIILTNGILHIIGETYI